MLRKLGSRIRIFPRLFFSTAKDDQIIKAQVKVIKKEECEKELTGLYQSEEHL